MRLRGLYECKKKSITIDQLVENPTFKGIQKQRRDRISGNPIWCRCWHQFTSVKKGQQFRCKIIKSERVKEGEGQHAKWVTKTQWARHPKRFMSLKMKEFRLRVIQWGPYLAFREEYLHANPKVPRNWHVTENFLYQEMCFCVDPEEDVRKCGCEYHLKMSELLAGLKRWRQRLLPVLRKNDHSCAVCSSDEYISCCENVSALGMHLCPCPRKSNGERHLQCVLGNCDVCNNPEDNLLVCAGEKDFFTSDVKYKWLRPVKIGNRSETVWAYDTKPYHEYTDLLCSYYTEKYRLHNWVYHRQQTARKNCRKYLQPGNVILEFDYAAKAAQFQQDCMPCTASRQTSKFICFAHFNPTLNEFGHNIGDVTEVFAFHSNCLKQDSQSIRRCLTHVTENLKDRGHLKSRAHLWADGSAAQNKGRKAFRNLSELSLTEAIEIIQNFACTHHFEGPWDTEGGRETRAITSHIRNGRDQESVLDAGDNVFLLRKIMTNAGEPDPPIKTQKMWRPPALDATFPTQVVNEPVSKPKPKRQSRGRTEEELAEDDVDPHYVISRRHILRIEPCECKGSCKCPNDGRLTYVRDEKYDCTAVEGTLSTYCYKFSKKALHLDVRQYSCYCRWCACGEFAKCTHLDVVRHRPNKPVKPFEAGYRQWRDEGWRHVVLTPRSAPDKAVTRTSDQSIASACAFISKLPFGSTFAVRTNVEGKTTFWLASKQSEIKKATVSDVSTGVEKGEKILSVLWYDRLSDYKYIKLDDLTEISVASVIVTKSKVAWHRTTANRYYLGEHTHNIIQKLVNNLSEL